MGPHKVERKRARHTADQPFFGFFKTHHPDSQSSMLAHFVASSGEFVGTFLFLYFAFLGHLMSVDQAADKARWRQRFTDSNFRKYQSVGSLESMSYADVTDQIALSYGFSLLVTAWNLYRVSGGLFNPAVTLGMVLTGTLSPVRAVLFVIVQFLGAICAAALVSCMVPGDITNLQTTLGAQTTIAQGVFIEMFLTALLVFTVLMLAAEKHESTYIAPIGIGMALFVVEVAGVYWTGASVNPARSLGPCVAAASFQGYHWIYYVGPLLGALISAGYFHFIKFFHYEEANPGQVRMQAQYGGSAEKLDSATAEKESPTAASGEQDASAGVGRTMHPGYGDDMV
ncbi:putative MIP aquaporin TC1A8 family protein [Teratosphaeria destructans]|uniref:MIP aquaporin TC1A8 family protein n=1 Tax=Teratosphaeria destructans TaxID=418781 RepID=A0A9W7VZU0_9PEZI|nr:putative MIP aquaporin TC1A8 family protein [Teratosphaeria destructans]